MISVRYGAPRVPELEGHAEPSATAAKSARSGLERRSAAADAKSIRMKKRPVQPVAELLALEMLPPCSTRKPDTACTIPGRSGQTG